jgi:hypothetical protein
MTDEPFTSPTEPGAAEDPPVDPVDERLSARLDGESDPVADEPPVDTPRAEDRRRALAAARDLLAIPPLPVDDVTRRRLLRTALGAAAPARRSERDRQRWNRLGAAAALLVVVVGGAVALTNLGSGSDGRQASKSAATESATTTVGPKAPSATDLGEVSDPAVLRRRVEAALRSRRQPSTTTLDSQNFSGEKTTEDGLALSPTSAPSSCAAKVRVPSSASTPTTLADASYKGAPAVVLVATDGPRTLVFVLATADCRLLTSQFLRQ